MGDTPTGGGALNVAANSVVQFNNCVFVGNTATVSGGALEIQAGARVTVQGCQFLNNRTNGAGHAAGSEGGAIHVGNATLTAYNTRFEGNQSAAFGGAVHAQGVFGVGTATVLASNCSFVNNGAIDADMFNDANGEHLFIYAKLEPFIPMLREQMGAPQFLAHLEKTVKALPDYEQRVTTIRERIQKMIELWQQKNAAQAAAASN